MQYLIPLLFFRFLFSHPQLVSRTHSSTWFMINFTTKMFAKSLWNLLLHDTFFLFSCTASFFFFLFSVSIPLSKLFRMCHRQKSFFVHDFTFSLTRSFSVSPLLSLDLSTQLSLLLLRLPLSCWPFAFHVPFGVSLTVHFLCSTISSTFTHRQYSLSLLYTHTTYILFFYFFLSLLCILLRFRHPGACQRPTDKNNNNHTGLTRSGENSVSSNELATLFTGKDNNNDQIDRVSILNYRDKFDRHKQQQQQSSTCKSLKIPICHKFRVGYTYTSLPNEFAQFDQDTISSDLMQFEKLFGVKCYSLLPLFICSIYAPKCSPDVNFGKTIPPCRSLCQGTCVIVSTNYFISPSLSLFSYLNWYHYELFFFLSPDNSSLFLASFYELFCLLLPLCPLNPTNCLPLMSLTPPILCVFCFFFSFLSHVSPYQVSHVSCDCSYYTCHSVTWNTFMPVASELTALHIALSLLFYSHSTQKSMYWRLFCTPSSSSPSCFSLCSHLLCSLAVYLSPLC